jgi:hypothetical protein
VSTEVPVVSRRAATSAWVRRAAPSVVVSWVAARVGVALSFLLADRIAPHVDLPHGRLHIRQGLVTWDGDSYREIAEHGYAGARDLVRFFPLYPDLARVLAPVFGGSESAALLVIANVSSLFAMFVLWRLVHAFGYDDAVADRAVVIATLFPAATVLVFAYAEGPFLLALTLAALALQRGRVWWAVPPLFAMGLLRPTGVLVVAAVFVLAAQAVRAEPGLGWSRIAAWASALAAPIAGLASYLVWLEQSSGRGSAPLDVQRELRAGFHEPISRLLRAVWDVGTGDFRDVYNLAFVVALVAAVVISVVRRLPLAWTVYLVIGILVALSANNIDSIGRYGLLLAPALPLAYAVQFRRRAWFVAAVAVSSVGFVWFGTVTALGLVVP